jgi:CMP-N-acetylneuraminic acid synthetase
MKVVGVIPAKGTSTRVKGKNFREILGLPMYLWAANNLNKVLNRKDIYIDSENEEILYVCNELGFGIIERPKNYQLIILTETNYYYGSCLKLTVIYTYNTYPQCCL